MRKNLLFTEDSSIDGFTNYPKLPDSSSFCWFQLTVDNLDTFGKLAIFGDFC